jgi:hypothetical protein
MSRAEHWAQLKTLQGVQVLACELRVLPAIQAEQTPVK